MKVWEDVVPGACGISVLYDFTYGTPISEINIQGGTGLVCAGFIANNDNSDEAFKEMQKRGPLLFKSPVRKNLNSGNMFYFAIFDWSNNEDGNYGFDYCERDNEDQDF